MRALCAHHPGGPEVLGIEEVPRPSPGIGDALVAVQAASFTPTELSWPSTWTDRLGRDRAPVTIGHEVSGVVAELGYGTAGLSVGDEVFGLTDWYRDGTAADYVAVEARNLAPKPASLDHIQASTVPMAALTACQALFTHGHLRERQTVLIHGAAGGVGTFATQLAHRAGATVIATGRAPDEELLSELGADRIFDTAQERFEDALDPVDLVFDLVGGDVARRSWALVKAGGALVTVVSDSELGEPPPGVRKILFVAEPDRLTLSEIASRIDIGELRPVLGAAFDLEEGRKAFEVKRSGGLAGKLALRVAS